MTITTRLHPDGIQITGTRDAIDYADAMDTI